MSEQQQVEKQDHEERVHEERDHIGEMFARMERLQADATVDAVFGQPVETGDKMVIPIARVSYGFGFGFGEGVNQEAEEKNLGTGGGGGGGVSASPLGLVEITPEQTRVEPIINEQTMGLAGIAFAAWTVFWTARAVIRIFGR